MENKGLENSAHSAPVEELANALSPFVERETRFSTTASELLAESTDLLQRAADLLTKHKDRNVEEFQRLVASNFIETAGVLQKMATNILSKGTGLSAPYVIDTASATSQELVALYSLYETRRTKSSESYSESGLALLAKKVLSYRKPKPLDQEVLWRAMRCPSPVLASWSKIYSQQSE